MNNKATKRGPIFGLSEALFGAITKKAKYTGSMMCDPPLPKFLFFMGDLVPAGLVLYGLSLLREKAGVQSTLDMLEQKLILKRQGLLWPFHSKGLVTSTDSSLILLGFRDPEGIKALERFNDGEGRYVPQLWSNEKKPEHMQAHPVHAHWRQADYATSALVRYLQRSTGPPLKASLTYILDGFETRSGLYFANPWFVDWVVALAIADEESASPYRRQLISEVLASRNVDGSFGCYDRELSTACAILALKELRFTSPETEASGQWLRNRIEFLNEEKLNIAIFYSTDKISFGGTSHEEVEERASPDPKHIIKVKNSYYGISYYYDSNNIITLSLALAALAETPVSGSKINAIVKKSGNCHDRYKCKSNRDYIKDFALFPYINS